ncbi:hypothetical protein EXS73_00485 [Candidatus Pacearchaeota archaeon]|nr:hypothetical protein [Candidatus Pacearchaeota archaeon]
MRIALISSQGGHAGQAGIIFTPSVLKEHSAIFITESPDKSGYLEKYFQKKYRTYFFPKDSLGVNPVAYSLRFFQLRAILKKEHIQSIVTNGAHLSIPAVLAARSLGIYVIFIDTFIRVKTPNWSARFCYWFADTFLVQHETMKEKYGKKAEFRGSVL